MMNRCIREETEREESQDCRRQKSMVEEYVGRQVAGGMMAVFVCPDDTSIHDESLVKHTSQSGEFLAP